MSADSQKAYGGLAGVKEALASLGRAGIVPSSRRRTTMEAGGRTLVAHYGTQPKP